MFVADVSFQTLHIAIAGFYHRQLEEREPYGLYERYRGSKGESVCRLRQDCVRLAVRFRREALLAASEKHEYRCSASA